MHAPTRATLVVLALTSPVSVRAEGPSTRAPVPVRGHVTRAAGPVTIDGHLDEWSRAFCTPVAYNHKDPANRAGQFFYLWDDQALYIGLRALDTKRANPGVVGSLFNGDAVEFYLDTRGEPEFRGKDWSPGAIHLHITAFTKDQVAPRWSVRRGIATSDVILQGVEMAAQADAAGYTLEMRFPWSNFAGFTPRVGAILALDAELCSGDGATRVDSTLR